MNDHNDNIDIPSIPSCSYSVANIKELVTATVQLEPGFRIANLRILNTIKFLSFVVVVIEKKKI